MPHLVLTGDAECDLVSVLRGNRIRAARYETAAEALAAAPDQAALMVLAGRGGADPAPLPAAFWDEAARKKLRLYCECPSAAPGLAVGEKRVVTLERAVIASGAFGIGLPRLRILSVPEIQFSLLAGPDPLIVLAKVAGYDRAVYGIPGEGAHWLLGRLPGYDALVSSLPLSGFITGRFSPAAEWARVWSYILNWLVPGLAPGGLQVKPSVSPAYGRSEPMPADVQEQTLRRGAEWFFRAKLLVHAAWEDEYWKFRPYPGSGEPPRAAWPCGDGSLGLLEGFNTVIRADGTQPAMWYRRTDCNGTAGGALVAAGAALREPRYVQAGARVCDFLVFRSRLSGGIHADTRHPAFGLLGWHDRDKYHGDANGCDIHYGDDNACALLGLLAAAALIRTDRWDRRILQGILANFRTTGRFGFRHANLTTQRLVEHGWRHFFNGDPIQYEPHFQAYPWACYLWAHRRTGWKELLARTETAIRMTLEAYPDNWKWTNGIQQERARMLLPLAWLVRLRPSGAAGSGGLRTTCWLRRTRRARSGRSWAIRRRASTARRNPTENTARAKRRSSRRTAIPWATSSTR